MSMKLASGPHTPSIALERLHSAPQTCVLFCRADTAAAFNISVGDVQVTAITQVRILLLPHLTQRLTCEQKLPCNILFLAFQPSSCLPSPPATALYLCAVLGSRLANSLSLTALAAF